MRAAKILLVEDCEADVDLLKHCLKKNKMHLDLVVKNDGESALSYLNDQCSNEHDSYPDIVLLDINLPGMSGIQVLQHLKENPETKLIPAVMLTSSKSDEDVIRSYSNHANCFLQKPLDLKAFDEILRIFEEFWLSIVTLPTHDRIS